MLFEDFAVWISLARSEVMLILLICHESPSATLFVDPGLYLIVYSNLERNSAHRACRLESDGCVDKY